MRAGGHQSTRLTLGLILVGVIAWWLNLRPQPLPDATSLLDLPLEIRGWEAIEFDVDDAVAEMLRADANVQRTYLRDDAPVIFLYVGYYGTKRGGVPEHTPEFCYPSQGWVIERDGVMLLSGARGTSARELLVSREGEKRLVVFWYRTASESGITSILRLRLSRIVTRLTSGRGDGGIVRLSTPIGAGGLESARRRIRSMSDPLDQALDDLWPHEVAPSELEEGWRPGRP